MLNVKSFKTLEQQDELNDFLNKANMTDGNARIEIQGDYTHVIHTPELDLAEAEKLSVAKRLRRAKENLVEARLHKAFLSVVNILDDAKLQKSKEGNELEIHNLEEQIKLYETWEVLAS